MAETPELTASLFLHASEGIIVADHSGKIVMANPRAEQMLGYEKSELIGKNIDALVPEKYSAGHSRHRSDYAKNPHARTMGAGRDLNAKRKDGSVFPVEISLSPFSMDDEQYIMSFIVDISQRKKQEEQLRKLTEEYRLLNAELEKRVVERTEELADAINKLASSKREILYALEKEKELNELKSRFVTMASHEFRTPLSTILSSVSLIGKYTKSEEDEKRQKHINKIKASVTNLTEILNDFLSIGKLEEGVIQAIPTTFNLVKFSREIAEDIQGVTKAGQKIIYSHNGNEEEVNSDRQILKNSLVNLLSNAIKYSGENQPIEFNTKITEREIIFSVKDSGIGIPDEDQTHIFERFFRAKNSNNIQGTGLGLNIVKKYIDLMDGSVTFTSKYGEGTTFTIQIPKK